MLAGHGGVACAQSGLIPYGAAEFEHSTNVFYLSPNVTPPLGNSGPTFADGDLRVVGGLDATYEWDRQKFHATGEARRFAYDHFTYLDHGEYLVDTGFNWKLGAIVDGIVDYRRERRMVPFQELIESTELFLESEDIASASANVEITPEWRLENAAKNRTLYSPRPSPRNTIRPRPRWPPTMPSPA